MYTYMCMCVCLVRRLQRPETDSDQVLLTLRLRYPNLDIFALSQLLRTLIHKYSKLHYIYIYIYKVNSGVKSDNTEKN